MQGKGTKSSRRVVRNRETEIKETLLEDEASSERKPFAFPRNIF